jgi:signal transduction histidine kinase
MIEAVLLIALITMTLDYLRTSNHEGLSKRAITTATLFATTTKDAILSYDLASLEAFVNEVLKNPDLIYARVLGPQGQLFASAGDEISLNKTFVNDTSVADIADGVYDSFAIIEEGGVSYGRVEIGIDVAPLIKIINEAKQRSITLGIMEMLLVALFSYILGNYLTSQLKQLTRSAKAISIGNLDINMMVKGSDEIAEVSKAFNVMAINLKIASDKRDIAETELKSLNLSLENRVARRTEQLETQNKRLILANEEIKQAQTNLLQSEKMASLGLMAAGVAHEINNPMSYVISNLSILKEYQGYYQTLLDDYRIIAREPDINKKIKLISVVSDKEHEFDMEFVEEDIETLIKDTQDGSIKVKEIVKGLKEFSHLDHKGELALHNINQCIESTLKIANNHLKNHCEINCNFGSIESTLLSAGQINQVLLNIILNAGQAIKGKGWIKITSYQEAQNIIVKIEDNGQGIGQEELSKIFDPFFTTKSVGVGTGLGLSISYGIIKDHSGRIEVSSKVGQGTLFSIILPIRTELSLA